MSRGVDDDPSSAVHVLAIVLPIPIGQSANAAMPNCPKAFAKP
jgi:hypothetical protein